MLARAMAKALFLATSVGLGAACGAAEDAELASSALETASAEAGYRFIANGSYIGTGVPARLFRMGQHGLSIPIAGTVVGREIVETFFPLLDGESALHPSEVPGREGPNAELAYAFTQFETARGNEVVSFTCLSCHTGNINGRFIVGLGDTHRDWTGDLGKAANSVVAAAKIIGTKEERLEADILSERFKAIAPHVRTSTVGVNPAVNLTYALMAHRDPRTLEWSEAPLMTLPSNGSLPYDVPPWWHMRRRTTDFASAELKFHQGMIMLASLLGTEDVARARTFERSFADVVTYLRQVSPPPFPNVIDRGLAQAGEGVFNRACASCHGTYGANASYPETVTALESVGTDPKAAQQQLVESDRFYEWLDTSYYASFGTGGVRASRKLGYLARPLDGVWATAPFFHNGSVPNLEGVLDSTKRPKFWTRGRDTRPYAVDRMSVEYETLSAGKGGHKERLDRHIYDTTEPGYSNAGHTYGDALTPSERTAVLEYLKTL